jgi:hypothetical protein
MRFTRDELRREGFTGFHRFKDLDLAKVPETAGVYVLLRESDDRPTFLERSRGGHFKGKDPTVPVEVLEARWIDGVHCVYIGKASHTASTNLRRRLSDFRRYGRGQAVGHQGGRYVWQVADSDEYVVAWKATGSVDPREVERDLIARFLREHGRQPLGNISA